MIINQAIYVPHLDHHLLCPMQCRVNDVILDEPPKFLAIKPTDQTHALTVPDPDDPSQTLTLPLTLRGLTSLLHMRNVTADDFYNDNIPRIDLTSETLTWDLLQLIWKLRRIDLTCLIIDLTYFFPNRPNLWLPLKNLIFSY